MRMSAEISDGGFVVIYSALSLEYVAPYRPRANSVLTESELALFLFA
jgi:hypothetical protein